MTTQHNIEVGSSHTPIEIDAIQEKKKETPALKLIDDLISASLVSL